MPQDLSDDTSDASPASGEQTCLGSILAPILSLGETELELVRAHRPGLQDDSAPLRRRVEEALASRPSRWTHSQEVSSEALANELCDHVMALLDGDIGSAPAAEAIALGNRLYRSGIQKICAGAALAALAEHLDARLTELALPRDEEKALRRALMRLLWWDREMQLSAYDSRIRLENLLMAEREITALIAGGLAEPELLRGICRVVTHRLDLALAWISRIDPGGGATEVAAGVGGARKSVKDLREWIASEMPVEGSPVAIAAGSGESVFINDLARDEDFRPWLDSALGRGLRSLAVLPLRAGGDTPLVLTACASEPAYFDEELRGVLKEIARDVSHILTEKRRLAELDRLRDFYAARSEVNQLISHLPTREDLLMRAVQILAAGTSATAVYLLEAAETDPVRCIRFSAGRAHATVRAMDRALAQYMPPGPCAEVIATCRPMIVNRVSDLVGTPEGRECLRHDGVEAVAAFPVAEGEDPIAQVFVVAMPERDVFTPDVVHLLGELSQDIALGLADVARREHLSRLQGYYAAVADVGRLAAQAPNEDVLLKQACNLVVRHTAAKVAYIVTVDPVTERMAIGASEGPAGGFIASLRVAAGAGEPGGDGMAGRVYRSGAVLVTNDLLGDARFGHMHEGLKRWQLEAGAGFPVFVSGAVRAVLVLGASLRGHFTDELTAVVGRMTEAIGTGLARVAERRSAQRYHAFYTALANLNELIARDPAPELLYAEACRALADIAPDLFAYLARVTPGSARMTVEACAGMRQELVEEMHAAPVSTSAEDPAGQGIAGNAYRAGHALVWDRVPERAETLRNSQLVEALGVRSMLGIPIIKGGECTAVLVLGARQGDYFDPDLVNLGERLAENIGFALQAYERSQALQTQALSDPLTGLPNRNLYDDRLRMALARAHREGRQVAVALIDLDNFKEINDRFGHGMGDRVLSALSERILETLREGDTLACFGGDELVAVLPMDDAESHVGMIIERMLAAVRPPLDIGSEQLSVRASVGIAVYPHDAEAPEDLLRRADLAMYRAKRRGGDGWAPFEPELEERLMRRFDVRRPLEAALDRNEFELYFQPFAELATGRITGMEALLRWRNPQLGLVPPSEFIPIAEESGLIIPIGEWVLHQACGQLARLQAAGHRDLRVAVNLSARQFRQPDLAERVSEALQANGVLGQRLEVEITETTVMENVEAARQMLAKLHSHGVTIALDDFGTGYSSLSYLRDFHIDYLKVDQSFVRSIPDEEESAAITRTILAMARGLGIGVVAEGIETEPQIAALSDWGCEEGQGYLLSMPLASDDLQWLLATTSSLPMRPGMNTTRGGKP